MKVGLFCNSDRVACSLICLSALYLFTPLAAHEGSAHENDVHPVEDLPAPDTGADVFKSIGKFASSPPVSARLTSFGGGSWSSVEDWPVLAVHATLLPNGKVLAWDATPDDFDEDPHTASSVTTRVTLWDPVLGTHSSANNDTDTDLFCAGSAHLWDGRILFAGGDSEPNGRNGPLVNSNIYDASTNQWERTVNMQAARWYSSVTPLANGEMLTLGGSYSPNPLAEVFQLDEQWRPLDLQPPFSLSGDYQWFQTAPDGNVVYFGPHDLISTIHTEQSGRWDVDTVRDGFGYRGYGSYAMYQPDRILISGGGNSWDSSVVLDAANKQVSATSDMHFGRRQHNLTILADGSVLATGGNSSGSDLVDLFTGIFEPEIWNPQTGRWSLMNPMTVDRQYHSVALLLPDGRVLSAGGGYCGVCTFLGYHEQNAEIFSPPYLFNGDSTLATRPRIVAAPQRISYRDNFEVRVDDGAAISRAHLVKLGSVTHSQNQDQRLVPLQMQQFGNTLSLSAPAGRELAPPGHYMLFVLRNGTPSVASIVRIGEPQLGTGQGIRHSLEAGERQWFEVNTEGNASVLSVAIGEMDADVDLLVAGGNIPTVSSRDSIFSCVSRNPGTLDELCNVSINNSGRWYVGAQSRTSSANYTLRVGLSDQAITSPDVLLSNVAPIPEVDQRIPFRISMLDAPTIPPRVFSTVYSANAAEIFWDASVDNNLIAGYEVFRNGDLLRRFDARSLYQTDLVPGVEYRYAIRAFDDEGKFSPLTASHIVNTANNQPSAPTLVSLDGNQMTAVPTGDELPQSSALAPASPAVPVAPVATVVPVAPVVQAAPQTNSSDSPPSVPVGLRSEVYSSTAAEIFWDAANDDGYIAGYDVYRNGQLLGRFDAQSLYQDSLRAGEIYIYDLRSVDNRGNTSDRSEPHSLRTTQAVVIAGTVSAPNDSRPIESTFVPPTIPSAPTTAPTSSTAVAVASSEPVVVEAPAAVLPARDVIELRLINARTNQIISRYSDIDNGDAISLGLAGESQLNIEADIEALDSISRVQFDFNGKERFRTESFFPFALFGDHGGDFIGVPLTIGTQNLSVQVYRGSEKAESRSITFAIVP